MANTIVEKEFFFTSKNCKQAYLWAWLK